MQIRSRGTRRVGSMWWLVATVASIATAAVRVEAQSKFATWKATELWRVDGSELGEPFSALRDFVVLNDGALWALDFKDQDIRRYDARGKALSKVGRKGAGPGEMYNANGMAVHPDNTVWVNDPNNGRRTIFNADGKFVRQVLIPASGYGYQWSAGFVANGAQLAELRMAPGIPTWDRFDMQGKPVGAFPQVECPNGSRAVAPYTAEGGPNNGRTIGSYPFTTGGGVRIEPSGNMWCAGPHSRRVALIRAGSSDTLALTTLDIQPVPVERAERDSAIARIEKRIAPYAHRTFDAANVPNERPGIASLYVDADGRLIVLHGASGRAKQSIVDLFDAKGKHVARVLVPERVDMNLPMRARGDMLWVAALDDDDVPSVVCFRLQRQ